MVQTWLYVGGGVATSGGLKAWGLLLESVEWAIARRSQQVCGDFGSLGEYPWPILSTMHISWLIAFNSLRYQRVSRHVM